MDTDDGLDANLPTSVVGSNSGIAIIRASGDGYWADLEVEYSWNGDGTVFSVTTLRYKASGNNRREGNIKLGLTSKNFIDYIEITDRANQDGEWHNLSYSLTVAGNVKVAHVHLLYIYDKAGGDPNLWGDASFLFRPPEPVITSPPVSSPSVVMTGTGGVVFPNSIINILDSTNFSTLSHASIESNGNWRAEFNAPSGAGTINCFALQMIGLSGKRSPDVTITVTDITLTRPVQGTVVRSDLLEFEGKGAPTMKIWTIDSNGTALSDQGTVGSDKNWKARGKALANGNYKAWIVYQVGNGPVVYTKIYRDFTVLGKLNIIGPDGDQEMNFTVTGANGMTGAQVKIKKDLGGEEFGSGVVGTAGAWRADVTMTKPGVIRLVAEQTYNGVPSGPSNYKEFRIKPPQLIDIQVTPGPDAMRFSGAGYNTAKVDLHIKGNGTPVDSTDVSSGRWTLVWAIDWNSQPPEMKEFDIRQKISDDNGGWIYSKGAELSVQIPVPVPTLEAQVGEDRNLVLSGTGHYWRGKPNTTIEVEVRGDPAKPDISDIPVNDEKSWSYTSAEKWNPGSYLFRGRQLFKAQGDPNPKESEWTDPVSLIIPTPVPTLTITENVLEPKFQGGCLEGATVMVWFDEDSALAEEADTSGETWTYARPELFIPGTYTVHVTQAINGQTSNKISLPFTVVVTKPVITPPVDGKVDHNPIIKGTAGIQGATMTVFNDLTGIPLGEAQVTGNDWSVPVLEDLPFGSHTVYAVQKYEGFPSEESERVTFTVILFPPVIDHPRLNEAVARDVVIDGHARKAARVELWLKDEDTPLKRVGAGSGDGYWRYEVHMPVGHYVLRARQIFGETEETSDFGDDLSFTVVPAIPVIESPTLQQQVGATVSVSGFGYAGDWVEVAWSDALETVLGSTQVQVNRTWSLAVFIEKPTGEHSWCVQQVSGEYRSGWSEAHPVWLLSPSPTFTTPEPGHWFAGLPIFEGTGETGETIELSHWFDTRQRISQGDLVASGSWTASPDAPLPLDSHWVKARQGDSEWGESARFEVDPTEQKS